MSAGLIFFIGYVLVGILVAWYAGPRLFYSITVGDEIELEDYVFGSILSLLVGALWPLSVIVFAFAQRLKKGVEKQLKAEKIESALAGKGNGRV